jgi:flagellar basal body P-ring formation protein FlgA
MKPIASTFAFAAVLLAATSVLAGAPVSLRSAPVAAGTAITLADLFDGAMGPAGTVVVGRGAPGSQAVLDSGQVQVAAHAAGLDWDNARGLRRIIVTMTAAPAASAEPRARHRRAAQVLVYARNINANDLVQASDLEWSDEAVAGADAPRNPEEVIGKAARFPLRAGAAVASRDLTSPKVVKRGDMISVDFNMEGVSLSLTARAMNDAAVGEPVQVTNPSSKKVIEAVATRPGHAGIGPEADALRTAPFATAALR